MQLFTLSDELWERIAHHVPTHRQSFLGGRPRPNSRKVFEGIAFIKAYQLPWRATPREVYGSKAALNDYYRYCAKVGVFHALKNAQILTHSELIEVDFDWPKIQLLFGQKGLS